MPTKVQFRRILLDRCPENPALKDEKDLKGFRTWGTFGRGNKGMVINIKVIFRTGE